MINLYYYFKFVCSWIFKDCTVLIGALEDVVGVFIFAHILSLVVNEICWLHFDVPIFQILAFYTGFNGTLNLELLKILIRRGRVRISIRHLGNDIVLSIELLYTHSLSFSFLVLNMKEVKHLDVHKVWLVLWKTLDVPNCGLTYQ